MEKNQKLKTKIQKLFSKWTKSDEKFLRGGGQNIFAPPQGKFETAPLQLSNIQPKKI